MSSSIDEDLSEMTEYITLENPEVFEKHYASLVTEFKSQIEAKKATRSKVLCKKLINVYILILNLYREKETSYRIRY